MSEITIIYCVFMYLLAAGTVLAGFTDESRVNDPAAHVGMAIHLLFAPLVAPVVLGWVLYGVARD